MIPPLLETVLSRYRSALEHVFSGRVERVILFGSFARGEAHEESDVDVLVILRDAVFRDKAHAMDLATETGLEAGFVLSPVVFTPDEWEEMNRRELLFPQEVESDGIEVAL